MAELPKDMIFHYHSDDGVTIKVDAIPLVHCSECRYDGRCMFQSFVIDNSRDEVPYDRNTFFCADGERR